MNRRIVKVTVAASLVGVVGLAAVDEKHPWDQPHIHAESPLEPEIDRSVEIAAPVTHRVSSTAVTPLEFN